MNRKTMALTTLLLGMAGAPLMAEEPAAPPAASVVKEPAKPKADSAKKKKFVFRNQNRRNPFELRLTANTTNTGTKLATKTLSLKKQAALVKKSEKLVFKMITMVRKSQISAVVDAANTIATRRILIKDKALTVRMNAVQKKVDTILEKIDDVQKLILYKDGKKALVKMKKAFEAEAYDAVVRLGDPIRSRIKTFKPADEKPIPKKIVRLAEEISELSRRAAIRAEFIRMKRTVGGVFLIGNNRSVIIDGRLVEEGESLGPVKISLIEKGPKVTYEYKGEIIVVVEE